MNDVLILYIAGHGLTNEKDGLFYFLPYDTENTSACTEWQACNNLCVCFVKSVDGVCGMRHKESIYTMESNEDALSSKDPWLCADGKIDDFDITCINCSAISGFGIELKPSIVFTV